MVNSKLFLFYILLLVLLATACNPEESLNIGIKVISQNYDSITFEPIYYPEPGDPDLDAIKWTWDFGTTSDNEDVLRKKWRVTYAFPHDKNSFTVHLHGNHGRQYGKAYKTILLCPPMESLTFVSTGCSSATVFLPNAHFMKDVRFYCDGLDLSYSHTSDTAFDLNFPSSGTYDVNVEVQPAGCTQAIIKTENISVGMQATASFSFKIFGRDVCFKNETVGGNEYTWEFGDEQGGSMEHPLHRYAEPGTYLVTLTVKSNPCAPGDIYEEIVTIPAIDSCWATHSYLSGNIMGVDHLITVPEYEYPDLPAYKIRGDALPIYSDCPTPDVDYVNSTPEIRWNHTGLNSNVMAVISKERFEFGIGRILNPNDIIWAWNSDMAGTPGKIRFDEGRKVLNGDVLYNEAPESLQQDECYFFLIYTFSDDGKAITAASREHPIYVEFP